MKFFLQRDGRTYGPYSFDDLKRYQAENRIGPNDLVRREDSQQWEPWQQVLNPPAMQAPSIPAVTPVTPEPQTPAFGGFTPPASTPPASQPGFGTNPPAFGGGGFGQPPASTPPAFGGGGFGQPPASGGFGQPPSTPPSSFGQPPATPSSFGQPPADQGFGGGGFGGPVQQSPQASDVPGAFGAFGAQAFGGPPQGGGFGGAPQGGFGGAPQGGFGGGGVVGPMPPDMQWWLVAIISFVCGLFQLFWLWKQATFVAKIDPQTQAPKFYKMGFAGVIAGYILVILGSILGAAMDSSMIMIFSMLGMVVVLGGAVCIILANFKMRESIHNYYTMVEPMGINLMDTSGAVLTFFFSIFFFQYHFANIAARKKAMGHPAA